MNWTKNYFFVSAPTVLEIEFPFLKYTFKKRHARALSFLLTPHIMKPFECDMLKLDSCCNLGTCIYLDATLL